jgi:ABC-type branched-subunit amino acid transport system ATPase component/ABC-type branched-subunit amino acid transport system permease subunit
MEYILSISTFAVIWAILALSLNILLGYAGQVSVGHAAFFGIGAYTAAILSTRYHIPFLLTIPASMLVTAFVGMILGLPSLRVRHDFLVLVTIGLNFIFVGTLTYTDFFGGALGIVGIPAPAILGMKLKGMDYLLFCTSFLLLTAWINWVLPRTWGGLGLFALKDDESAAESVGISHARYKIIAFALSGAFAGLGGALYAPFVGNVFPDRFGFTESVTLVSMLVFGGIGSVRGAIFGAFVLKSLPEFLRFGGGYRFAFYGALLLVTILFLPEGALGDESPVWQRIQLGWQWLRRRLRYKEGTTQTQASIPTPRSSLGISTSRKSPESDGHLLSVHDVTVDFGGLRALDGVSFAVCSNEILGLIGPNGAGKTTLFNAIAGVVPLTKGRIILDGKEIQGQPPHMSARNGVARTFQVVRPFMSMDVQNNVLSGLGVHIFPRLISLLHWKDTALPAAWKISRSIGLGHEEQTKASQLPIGLLRRLEIGRALGTKAKFILLDEPAAGLTHEEVKTLEDLVKELAVEGYGVILVEHNMRFAMSVCDRIVVLAAGKLLAEGEPEVVSQNPDVINAYLGSATT